MTKSKLVYKQYFKPDGKINVDGRYEDCEHRAFHILAKENSELDLQNHQSLIK